jgi:hypothetical protein
MSHVAFTTVIDWIFNMYMAAYTSIRAVFPGGTTLTCLFYSE